MNYLSFGLLILAVAVFVVAIRLHLVIQHHVKGTSNTCAISKRDMYRAAHGAMFLSAAYTVAEVRWLVMELDKSIPTLDDVVWNVLEAGFLLYIAWFCWLGGQFIKRSWTGCCVKGR